LHEWKNGIYIIPENFNFIYINKNNLLKINFLEEFNLQKNLSYQSKFLINKINFYKILDNKNNILLYLEI
jgi:hypothetical protein